MRAGLLCGILAPLLWAAMIVAVGELRPGFDHVGQYISELAERGSANAGLHALRRLRGQRAAPHRLRGRLLRRLARNGPNVAA
jgi:hypothetical protein